MCYVRKGFHNQAILRNTALNKDNKVKQASLLQEFSEPFNILMHIVNHKEDNIWHFSKCAFDHGVLLLEHLHWCVPWNRLETLLKRKHCFITQLSFPAVENSKFKRSISFWAIWCWFFISQLNSSVTVLWKRCLCHRVVVFLSDHSKQSQTLPAGFPTWSPKTTATNSCWPSTLHAHLAPLAVNLYDLIFPRTLCLGLWWLLLIPKIHSLSGC